MRAAWRFTLSGLALVVVTTAAVFVGFPLPDVTRIRVGAIAFLVAVGLLLASRSRPNRFLVAAASAFMVSVGIAVLGIDVGADTLGCDIANLPCHPTPDPQIDLRLSVVLVGALVAVIFAALTRRSGSKDRLRGSSTLKGLPG